MTTITTGTFYARSTRGLNDLRARAERLQTAIASGERLERGSDDPVAAAQLRSLSRESRFAEISAAAGARVSSDLALTDDGLSDFSAYVIRIKELTLQAASATISPDQRAVIGVQINEIYGDLIQLANSRDSAGHALFGGEATGDAYVRDAAGMPVYTGTAEAGALALGDGQSVVRGMTGPEFLNFTGPAGPTDLLTLVRDLGAALQGSVADPAQAARDALAELDAGLESITTAQTLVGSRMNWIDLIGDRRTERSTQRSEQQAEVGGTDLATSITALQEILTVLEASQASFTRLASLNLFAMLR
jgi:flagellar hook-associated protein 3 FlgL